MKITILAFIAFVSIFTACQRVAPDDHSAPKQKIRTVILTDMILDDGNSLIRYLYYSSWFVR